jgi:hypothetical protein
MHEQRAPRLLQHVFEFVRAICGIDVDQDRADTRSCELQDNPLSVVWRPNTNAISFIDSRCQQCTRASLNLRVEFSIRPAQTLVARHESEQLAVVRHDVVPGTADRFAA